MCLFLGLQTIHLELPENKNSSTLSPAAFRETLWSCTMDNSINYDDKLIEAFVIVSCVGGLSLLLLRMYQSQSVWPVHHYLRIDKCYAGMTVVSCSHCLFALGWNMAKKCLHGMWNLSQSHTHTHSKPHTHTSPVARYMFLARHVVCHEVKVNSFSVCCNGFSVGVELSNIAEHPSRHPCRQICSNLA